MSTFQKPPQPALLNCGPTRPLQDAVPYSTYRQPPYMTPQFVPTSMGSQSSQYTDCVSYLPNQGYTGSYEGSRPRPEVVSYTPRQGSEGTKVFVQIQSPYDIHASSYGAVYLCFGSEKCECTPQFLGFQCSAFQYALSVEAPPAALTGYNFCAVPLQVSIVNQDDYSAVTLDVGLYAYEQAVQSSPSEDSRKRRMSVAEHAIPRPTKKSSSQNLQFNSEPSDGYAYQGQRPTPYSPYLQSLPALNGYAAPYHAAPSPRPGMVQYSGVSSTPPSAIRAPSPVTPSWGPSTFVAPATNDFKTPGARFTNGLPHHSRSSPSTASNPPLIRTSTLQQASGFGHVQSFNPYAMFPSKAVLNLNGDLDLMTENWTKEEIEAKRRLVQFSRAQNGSTIHADFKPVAPEDRAPNSICISCIHWDGKNECFVTSVDTIYLLESLVGVRFTVEEKNRIRRNLEGFRPLTVSKTKPDSEDFFKVIMGFPVPKPRNIEKDVKVFPWKILAHALKKIIGKYSASYSSTAGALPSPAGSNFINGQISASDSGNETHNAGSPQSGSDSTPPSTYGSGVAAASYSPHIEQTGPPISGASDLRTMPPAASQPYTSVAAPFPYPAVCQSQHQHGLSASVGRPWDMNALATNAPAAGPASNTSAFSYMAPMPYSIPGPTQGL